MSDLADDYAPRSTFNFKPAESMALRIGQQHYRPEDQLMSFHVVCDGTVSKPVVQFCGDGRILYLDREVNDLSREELLAAFKAMWDCAVGGRTPAP